ncbi:primosomal protein N' [Clostridium fermenticellae]|uniref:Replication restart protein PriA n=1 Tax=Clostridium fermenticellae TaxID=2068654 RepID=A0A386H2S9_9CLOT|nr:primosomal protein N' [Clostridium fermenticellae]AYD40012.1 primosomal protein N' [Clostridium fermenticellae]
MNKYVGVIINNLSVQLDRIFTYRIPEAFLEQIDIGYRVKVPFGRSNKLIDAFIVRFYNEYDGENKIKDLKEICEPFPLFDKNDLLIIEEMRKKYLSTYLECIKPFLPAGTFKGMKNKKENVICVAQELDGKFLKDNYKMIYEVVRNNNGIYSKSYLSSNFNLSLSSINTLIKHGYLINKEKIVSRYDKRKYKKYAVKELNFEQKSSIEEILNSDKKVFLIHGVTGSGKTEIYMHLVSEMIKQNKESIILVPEIALTPQMVERFKGRFGNNISVFHSKLSDGERYDEWLRVKEGKVKLAIGARSAIFLPFRNLGLIVIDEEHEESYKSDSNPKYNAREIGKLQSDFKGCKLILGSATPSIETYYNCIKGNIELITIKNRVDGALMPKIKIVDMREELMASNKSIFSRELYNSIEDRLEQKEQIILFLNRRGFSTFVSCRKCGYVFKCEHCDISLTYHSDKRKLICHYCGTSRNLPRICPKCGSRYVKFFGVGTEKVEEEIKKVFPQAVTLRMDFDTTRTKNSYEQIYNDFKNGKADILIGTQMIAKGLDFKNVTLVGVIAADVSLNLPDFRSAERTFQLITQVSGRSGRGKKNGEVIIQTYNPDNYSIVYAAKNDYIGFFKEEIGIRKSMEYPPFTDILLINMSSKNENMLIKNIQNVGVVLKNKLEKHDKINMLGPCPCQISKIKELFRWQIFIKGVMNIEFIKEIKDIVYNTMKNVSDDIRISIDAHPNNLL